MDQIVMVGRDARPPLSVVSEGASATEQELVDWTRDKVDTAKKITGVTVAGR